MSTEILLVLLPMGWAVLSAIIALVLYRTSKAVLEGLSLPALKAKRASFAGSVAIFIVIFLLLRSATPGEIVVLTKAEYEMLKTSSVAANDATIRLASCRTIDPNLQSCAQLVMEARNNTGAIRALIHRQTD